VYLNSIQFGAKASDLAGPLLAKVLVICLIFPDNKHPQPMHAMEQAIQA
jgi:hypothetical protein